jgi:hypothetical protein
MLQAGRSWVQVPMRSLDFFSFDLILPAALGPGIYSACNRNEYQGIIKARPTRRADNLTAILEPIV